MGLSYHAGSSILGAMMLCGKSPLIPFVSLLLLLSTPSALATGHATSQECVVLLHGLYRSGLSMLAVEWKLEGAGYIVSNVSYPSLTHPIEELAVMAVEEGVSDCREQGMSRMNFVTHSLGGILLRQYLRHHSIIGLHRVVMMGPPNQGSQLADSVHSLDFLGPLEPQAVAQLGTGIESIPLRLGPVDFALGVIAGTANRRSFMPGSPAEASDGTVTVAETMVPGMIDFIEMDTSHTFMMWNGDVLALVEHFLRIGVFFRPPSELAP